MLLRIELWKNIRKIENAGKNWSKFGSDIWITFSVFDVTIVFEETAMKYLSITKISGTMILASTALVIVEIITNGNEKLKQRWRLKTSG